MEYCMVHFQVPIEYVSGRVDGEMPLIDCIVRVCCALNNVFDSVVPFE